MVGAMGPGRLASLRRRVAEPSPGDWLLALAFAAIAEFEIWVEPVFDTGLPGPRAALAVLVLPATLPLAWRQRAPLAVLAIMVAGLLSIGAVGEREQSGLGLMFAVLAAVYSVAAHSGSREALVGVAIVILGGAGYEALTWAPGDTLVDALVPYLLFAAAWVAGREVRRHRRRAATLADRAVQVEHERDESVRAAIADERARIARELHDVVAHGVSLMGVQAGAARRMLDPAAERPREALLAVERTSREALAEMHRMLGVLRPGEDELELRPPPELSQLEELVERAGAGGVTVELDIEGERRPLPAGLELSAYRIVQEALTNVRNHAGDARATVVVRYEPSALAISVKDDGPGPGRGRPGGRGHGLIGIRERAALHGGEVRIGAREGGGFAVYARLPVDT